MRLPDTNRTSFSSHQMSASVVWGGGPFKLTSLNGSPLLLTRYQHQWGGGAQVNKFEQVPSLGYQMSLAGQARW